MPQSTTLSKVSSVVEMIRGPPGLPETMKSLPSRSTIVGVIVVTFTLSTAVAGGNFGDWDLPPHDPDTPGPYMGGGDPHTGDPLCVTVGVAGNEAPAPPFGGIGNILCIDARNKTSKIIILFTFSCDGSPSDVCKVSYSYSGYSSSASGGFNVHVNSGGMYNNPDDMWAPVGIPPSTISGSNSENEADCAALHTIEFEVLPGTLLYVDNVSVTCLTVSVEEQTWSQIKALFVND